MAQNYTWPSISVSATNPSVGVNGATAPSSATEVAGINPSGNLNPLHTDASNNLLVAASSLPLPTGAATSANQTTQIAEETAIAASVASIDSKTVHVDTGAVVVASSALPTGASTSALQTSGNTSLSTIAGNQTNGTQVTSVSNFPATQPVSGTVTVVQPTGTNLHTVVDSSALPTGASTLAAQTTGNTSLSSIDTKTPALVSGRVPVDGSGVTQPISATALPLPTGAATSANQTTALSRLSGSLVPTAYNEIDLTYTGSNITLAVYKLAGTTVKTLTLTYTGDNLTSVVAS